ncbi:hypothetical protein SELMODRAFT_450201 [Selaginella moellendorffii]|uniref:Uncharacterized protein SmTPK1_1 n=1 Tax=Selaginella moellendorffii TaxID=88036 RepID=D8RPT8_SELML|nr:two-pore potassium channel 1 [Selaginella moellendorffii]EFJ25541.1 hypothetical protein SELMODRAFT_450201 [Selaginella moellendorffii]|eukprot:XP_002973167.1 two-pore potassium channel 1 [Selaginella moellendorffii]
MHSKPKRRPSKLEILLQEPLLQDHDEESAMPTISNCGKLRRSRSAPSSDCGAMKMRPKNISPAPAFGMTTKSYSPGKTAALILALYLAIGILCFVHVRDELHGTKTLSFVDALYFCVVTMTTVGYGDLVPATATAKLMTCLFVFVGFAIFGLLLGNAANYLVEKQERLLERAIEKREKYLHHKNTESDARIRRVHCKVAVAAGLVLVLFGAGISVLVKLEGMSFLDAFYCVTVTVTTLGYGDRSFTSAGGRIFAVVWILMSTVCVAQFVLYIAELVTEGRQHSLTKWILSRKITYSDFEAADLDDDGALSLTEYMVYKLKEMGKLEKEDLEAIVRQFQELDVDRSGTISLQDINLAQFGR